MVPGKSNTRREPKVIGWRAINTPGVACVQLLQYCAKADDNHAISIGPVSDSGWRIDMSGVLHTRNQNKNYYKQRCLFRCKQDTITVLFFISSYDYVTSLNLI